MMAEAARTLGWHAFPGTGRRQHAQLSEPRRLRVSRLLRPRRLPHQREGIDGGHDDPEGAGDQAPHGRHRGARDDDRGRTRDGRVSGVKYLKGGTEYFQPASVVLLASYVYENVRLLLLSKSKAFPERALEQPRPGRAALLQPQPERRRHARSFRGDLNNWYGLPAQGVAVDNWADDNFDHAGLDFIGGGNLWVYSDRRPIGAAGMSTFGRAPRWGSAWKAFIKENADRSNTAYLQKTTLPYEDNYLDLDPDGEGSAGLSRVPHHRRLQGERAPGRRIHPGQDGGVVHGGWGRGHRARTGIGTMGPTTHAYGGTRMGDNPETNVVDRWGFSHEVPNLGVLGASVMGTSGARNPTLTAQALAWRTADRLAKAWKEIAR